jgi:hypothetical protein
METPPSHYDQLRQELRGRTFAVHMAVFECGAKATREVTEVTGMTVRQIGAINQQKAYHYYLRMGEDVITQLLDGEELTAPMLDALCYSGRFLDRATFLERYPYAAGSATPL